MTDQNVTRKLTAIFYADVAGYSRLTGEDEAGTHRLLSAYLDTITSSIETYNGTVLHFAGDAILAEFATVSDAVICAVNTQDDLAARNRDLPDDRKVQFRIGVNLGDVIVDRGEIYGNGVNVAARLESLAEPGGICVSAAVRDAVGTNLPLDYEDKGEQAVKNITEPVRVYAVRRKPDAVMPPPSAGKTETPGTPKQRWLIPAVAACVALVVGVAILATNWGLIDGFGPKTEQTTATEAEPVSAACAVSEDKPTIAVLPFTNLSDDPKQGYLSDGISEDIITRLARRPDMVVSARTSSFAFKDKSLTVPEIARELGVGYVLEGSVQKAGDRIRITAQLIEAETGNHLWADRYDRDVKDLFAMQDEIAHRVSVELAVELTAGERARINFKSTKSYLAYDYFLRGMEAYARWTKKRNERARKLFEKAIELDPNYARAIAMLGWIYIARRHSQNWGYDPKKSMERAEELANKALHINENSSTAYALLGWIDMFKGDYDQAINNGKRAVALEPNDLLQYNRLALTLRHAGRLNESDDVVVQAKCLSPYPPIQLLSTEALNHYLSGRYEEAIATSRQILARKSSRIVVSRRRIIASYIALGREAEARAEAKILLDDFSKRFKRPYSFKKRLKAMKSRPYKDKSWIDVYAERLHKAGIPIK
jgi:adenylate cyclase